MEELGVPFTALRLCAPYGPRQSESRVMMVFIQRALRQQPLLYFGSGGREQGFVHVGDIARACVQGLESGAGGVFNISGSAVSMKSLALQVAQETGLPPSSVQAAGKPDANEDERGRFSTLAAEAALGWAPRITLAEGLRECIQACRESVAR
jgi:UDP-glucose 4-epimerase